MTIKKIPTKALADGYIFQGTALLDYKFTDKEMTMKEWVYKSVGEYLKLCENVKTCYAKEVELVLPAGDETDFKMGYSEFTSTVAEILKDKDEIEVSVKYDNTPDKTFIRLNASQLCDYLKENYEKCGAEITVNQSTVLDRFSKLKDGEYTYSLWFWSAFINSVPVLYKTMTDHDPTIKDEPKITKRKAWERLNSEIIYGGMYSVKGYIFPEKQGLGRLEQWAKGESNHQYARLLHNTLKIVSSSVL
jgi:hypothetical protein